MALPSSGELEGVVLGVEVKVTRRRKGLPTLATDSRPEDLAPGDRSEANTALELADSALFIPCWLEAGEDTGEPDIPQPLASLCDECMLLLKPAPVPPNVSATKVSSEASDSFRNSLRDEERLFSSDAVAASASLLSSSFSRAACVCSLALASSRSAAAASSSERERLSCVSMRSRSILLTVAVPGVEEPESRPFPPELSVASRNLVSKS